MAEDREQKTGAVETDNCTVRDGDLSNTTAVDGSGGDNSSVRDDPASSNDTVSANGEKTDDETKSNRDISNDNLVKYSDLTPDQRKAFHSAGGKAGAESKRKRKAAKEILETLLAADMSAEQREEVLGTAESLLGAETSAYAVMFAKMLQEACKGNVNAAAFIRDSAGDKPTDKQEVTASITQADMAMVEKVRRRLEAEKNGKS